MTPPIVGVFFFFKCEVGPSSLIDCLKDILFSLFKKIGVRKNEIERAVKHEKIERKVIYPKIFNAEYEFLR